MVSASTPSVNEPHSKAKANYKSTISGKLVASGISDVATASVHSDKNRLKKLMIMIIIIMNLSQETTWRAPEIDFRYETEARKVDFKFDALQVSLH